MSYLIAHTDDCEIIKVGPSYKRTVDASFQMVDVPTPCTCGGVKISVYGSTPSNIIISQEFSNEAVLQ